MIKSRILNYKLVVAQRIVRGKTSILIILCNNHKRERLWDGIRVDRILNAGYGLGRMRSM